MLADVALSTTVRDVYLPVGIKEDRSVFAGPDSPDDDLLLGKRIVWGQGRAAGLDIGWRLCCFSPACLNSIRSQSHTARAQFIFFGVEPGR